MQFSSVIGQNVVKERLRNSYREGRLAHAIMLLGPEGCGNLALATAFAQFISCPEKTESDSCGKCSTCKKFESLQFADLHFSFPFFNQSESEGKKTTSEYYMRDFREFLLRGAYPVVEDWRTEITKENKQLHMSVYEAQYIVQRLSLTSYEGGYKFMIIWLPEFMRTDCANKLLKIVEEPPDKTLFLFVCNSAENILPTILSRVQLLNVPAIEDSAVEAALMVNGIEISLAKNIAHFTNGNWSLALSLSRSQDPNEFFATQFQQWMRMCYARDVPKLLKWCSDLHELKRDEVKQFLHYALDQVRQNVMLNYVGENLSRLNEGEKLFSEKFARFINDTNVMELNEELNKAYDDISRNGYAKMILLDLSLKTHHLLRRQET